MTTKKTLQKQGERLKELERLAQKLGIKVSYSDMKFAGLRLKSGQCIFRGRYWLVLNRKDHYEEKVNFFLEAFENFDLSDQEISPELAEILAASNSQPQQT